MKTIDAYLGETEKALRHDCNRQLLAYLASFPKRVVKKYTVTTDFVVKNGKPVWKKEAREFFVFKGTNPRDEMFLPKKEPIPKKTVFDCGPELKEFYQFFDGLREEDPNTSGYFYPAEQISADCELEDWLITAKDKAAVKGRPVVFNGATGDQIVLTKSGQWVWFSHEEGILKEIADSFPGFLSKYLAYRSVGDGRPFDSFGRD